MTLIEAVLFISIALAVIVGGLVFYQQASLAMKVMNVKRHVQAAIVETRTIQDRTQTWSFPNPGGDRHGQDLTFGCPVPMPGLAMSFAGSQAARPHPRRGSG